MIGSLDFRVDGLPAPKGSTVAFRHNKSGAVITHASNRDRLKGWELCVRVAALRVRPRDPFPGPVGLSVTFYLPRPVRLSVARRPHPSVKPDLSKLLRGLEDALTGVLYVDDAQIVEARVAKRYCVDDERPGAACSLYPLEGGRS